MLASKCMASLSADSESAGGTFYSQEFFQQHRAPALIKNVLGLQETFSGIWVEALRQVQLWKPSSMR